MQWSPEQDSALKTVSRWIESGDAQVFRLFGYAGTGKTTLARHLAEHIDGEVAFGAFTGKAALAENDERTAALTPEEQKDKKKQDQDKGKKRPTLRRPTDPPPKQ